MTIRAYIYVALLAVAISVTSMRRNPFGETLYSIDESVWDAFNRSISGRLFDGRPMMAPCFGKYNESSPAAGCTGIQKGAPTQYFGGYQNVCLDLLRVKPFNRSILTWTWRSIGLAVRLPVRLARSARLSTLVNPSIRYRIVRRAVCHLDMWMSAILMMSGKHWPLQERIS